MAFLLYGLADSMRHALQSGVDVAGADRLITMHKISFTQLVPQSYENRIRAIDGVVDVTPQTWFGAWYQNERNQLPAFPVRPEAFLRMYPEYLVPEAERLAWLADRTGILIGRGVADLTGWKVGDTVPLRSSIWRRTDGSDAWEVTVSAIYDLPEGGDTRQILLHQDYFEEAKAQAKGLVGWYLVKVDDVERAQSIGRQIDLQFANSPAETKTSSERAMAQSFVNQVGNIGAILRAIVTAVFFTMLLVTANTMAQSVRERTNEIGVLKTLGFTQRRGARTGAGRSRADHGAGRRARSRRRVVARRAVRAGVSPVPARLQPAGRGHPDGGGLHGRPRPRGRCSAGSAGDASADRRGAASGMNAP